MWELLGGLFEGIGHAGSGRKRQDRESSRADEISAIATILIIVVGVPAAIVATLIWG